ncbi:hypothetical protein [Gordonia shandongensis]|uniref:hypothetical protein n=1 Tax=Gordonia shandongensis TaxID=376351 RepID=UPI0003FA9B2B|nr:hypothetical protein [Gordonia shandongensis]
MDISRAGVDVAAARVVGLVFGASSASPVGDALADAGLAPRDVCAVIRVGPCAADASDPARADSAGQIAAVAALGAPHRPLRTLDLVDDGCGVPSSIAMGLSLAAADAGAVVVAVGGAVLVLTAATVPAPSPRRSTEIDLGGGRLQSAVDHLLRAAPCGAPVVAAVPDGVRLPAGVLRTGPDAAAQIRALADLRAEGVDAVSVVAADRGGRGAAVVCALR